jgi:hypothetical protein
MGRLLTRSSHNRTSSRLRVVMQEDFGKNEASATVQAECRLALSQILGTVNEWRSGSCKDSGITQSSRGAKCKLTAVAPTSLVGLDADTNTRSHPREILVNLSLYLLLAKLLIFVLCVIHHAY